MLGPQATLPITVLLLTGGAAVPMGIVGIDLLQEDAENLALQAEASVDQALHDLNLLSMNVESAYGHTDDGQVTSLWLIVRATGDVDLDGLVLVQDGVVLDWSIGQELRGTTDDGLQRGELVRIDVDLATPWDGGEDGRIDLHGDGPAARWTLRTPHDLHPPRVELDA